MCCALPPFAEAGLTPLKRAVFDQFYVSTHRLLRVAQLRYDTVEWLHRPNDDRFRFRSSLIPEITLLRVVDPLQD